MNFFNAFRLSKLESLSLSAFRHYKKLWLIPITASLLFMVFLAGMFKLLYTTQPYAKTSWFFFGVIALALVASLFFVAIFIEWLMLITVFLVDQYAHKEKASFLKAAWHSFYKLPILVHWAFYLAYIVPKPKYRISTESPVLPTDSLKNYVYKIPKITLTFFLYPIIAFEDKNLFDSIKQSLYIMKHYFAHVSANTFIFTGLNLKVFPFLFTLGILLNFYSKESFIWIGMIFFIFCGFFMILFQVTAQTIVSTLLYKYIHNEPTGVFSRPELEEALK